MGLIDKLRGVIGEESDSVKAKNHSDMKEILYIDESRLASTFEQISTPVTYDKVSELEVKGSLTDAGAARKFRRVERPYILYEKLVKFIEFIEENELIAINRPVGWDQNGSEYYRIETMTARRGHLPAPSNDDSLRDLWIWVSEYYTPLPTDVPKEFSKTLPNGVDETISKTIASLVLIEENLDPSNKIRAFTGCSTLEILIQNKFLEKAIGMKNILSEEDFQNFSENGSQPLPSAKDVGEDALSILTTLGTRFGRERQITALYSVEAYSVEETHHDGHNHDVMTTVGYPICIWRANQYLD